jgi:hypothetical protein
LKERQKRHTREECLTCSLKLVEIMGLPRLAIEEHDAMSSIFDFICQTVEMAKMESPSRGDHST